VVYSRDGDDIEKEVKLFLKRETVFKVIEICMKNLIRELTQYHGYDAFCTTHRTTCVDHLSFIKWVESYVRSTVSPLRILVQGNLKDLILRGHGGQ